MIAVIDYKAGNLASVSNALNRLGTPFQITNDTSILDRADGIIFPGVGHAKPAMDALKTRNLDNWLKQTQKPVFGICLGMQLLFESSGEGDTECLGILPGRLARFESTQEKVPHMGWNISEIIHPDHPLLNGISGSDYFYFVHSYYAPVTPAALTTCHYAGAKFTAMCAHKNFMGAQFHPEKSGTAGEQLLKNFLEISFENKK